MYICELHLHVRKCIFNYITFCHTHCFFFFLRLIWFCNFFRWFCGVIREFCIYLLQLTTVQFPNRNIEGRYYRYQIAAVQVQRVPVSVAQRSQSKVIPLLPHYFELNACTHVCPFTSPVLFLLSFIKKSYLDIFCSWQ